MAAPLFSSRAAQGIWRSRRSCSTEALALLISKSARQTLATLKKSWTFCRPEATMSFPLRVRNDAGSATSSIALHAPPRPPPPLSLSLPPEEQHKTNQEKKFVFSALKHFHFFFACCKETQTERKEGTKLKGGLCEGGAVGGGRGGRGMIAAARCENESAPKKEQTKKQTARALC